MSPRAPRSAQCQVCTANESKYTCAQCLIVYCSVACFKQHKEQSCQRQTVTEPAGKPFEVEVADSVKLEMLPDVAEEKPHAEGTELATLDEPKPLRPLTSLQWPYIPEESAYPDPLKRDDPKTLQMYQYEAIATSPSIRTILATHGNLSTLLKSIDKLRGSDREHALQRALGVTAPELEDQLQPAELSEDVLALRELAEAVEAAVRGNNQSALGLNWGE